jgi:hypothetical protein
LGGAGSGPLPVEGLGLSTRSDGSDDSFQKARLELLRTIDQTEADSASLPVLRECEFRLTDQGGGRGGFAPV